MTYEPDLLADQSRLSIRVTFPELHPDTATVNVMRSAEEVVLVPGTGGAFAQGGITVTDWWAPYGTSEYHAEMFDAAGLPLGVTGSAGVTLWGSPNIVALMDPYDPTAFVLIDAELRFADSIQTGREISRYNVGGRVVALVGNPGLIEDVSLRCYSITAEQRRDAWKILKQGIVLVRTTPTEDPLPRLFYASVSEPREVPFDHAQGGYASVWDISGDQISPITVGAAVSSTPWQVYMDAFATWADMAAAYPTWLDAMKNPPGV